MGPLQDMWLSIKVFDPSQKAVELRSLRPPKCLQKLFLNTPQKTNFTMRHQSVLNLWHRHSCLCYVGQQNPISFGHSSHTLVLRDYRLFKSQTHATSLNAHTA